MTVDNCKQGVNMLAEQAASSCRASSRSGKECCGHRRRQVYVSSAGLVMVAFIFMIAKAYFLTAAPLVVGLLGNMLYIMVVLNCQLRACHIKTVLR